MYGTADIRLPDVKEPRMGLQCLQAAAGLQSHTSLHNSLLPGQGLRCLPDMSMKILAVHTVTSRVRYCVDMSCPACSVNVNSWTALIRHTRHHVACLLLLPARLTGTHPEVQPPAGPDPARVGCPAWAPARPQMQSGCTSTSRTGHRDQLRSPTHLPAGPALLWKQTCRGTVMIGIHSPAQQTFDRLLGS